MCVLCIYRKVQCGNFISLNCSLYGHKNLSNYFPAFTVVFCRRQAELSFYVAFIIEEKKNQMKPLQFYRSKKESFQQEKSGGA